MKGLGLVFLFVLCLGCKGSRDTEAEGGAPSLPQDVIPVCKPEFTITHTIGGTSFGPEAVLGDLEGEAPASSILLNLNEALAASFAAGGSSLEASELELGLTDRSAELFTLDEVGNLHIKERNSFLAAVLEGRRDFNLNLDGHGSRRCFTLSLVGQIVSKNFLVLSDQSFRLPYGLYMSRTYKTLKIGGKPMNYMGRVLAFTDRPQASLRFEIASVQPAGWRNFFEINSATGELSITNSNARIVELFDLFKSEVFSEAYSLNVLALAREKSDNRLPSDGEFVLTLNVRQEMPGASASEPVQVDVKAYMPKWGKADCALLSWDADRAALPSTGKNAWADSDIQNYRELQCKRLGYKSNLKASFVTNQVDLDNLPNGLSQARENYEIVFRDEFSKEGGPEVLDERLWSLGGGANCNGFESKDGALNLEVSKGCVNPRGKVIRVILYSKFEYKYGYFEAFLRGVPSGNPDGGSQVLLSSWGRRPISQTNLTDKKFIDYVCGGSNRLRKRQLWLNSYGVEKQYVELRNLVEYSFYWWVFHSFNPQRAKACHKDISLRPIYSGLLWNTAFFYPSDSPNGGQLRVGIEWTPSGYLAFSNGVPYGGNVSYGGSPSGNFQEYGYSVPLSDSYTAIYRYRNTPIPANRFINRTVSHAPQGLMIVLEAFPGNTAANIKDGWEESVEIDYIRVYQPKDKYAGFEKSYD